MKNVKVGTLVVISDAVNSTVYLVREVTDDGLHLHYWLSNGSLASGGFCHESLVKPPKLSQLTYRLHEILDSRQNKEAYIETDPMWAEYKRLLEALDEPR